MRKPKTDPKPPNKNHCSEEKKMFFLLDLENFFGVKGVCFQFPGKAENISGTR